jgi:hypothetical protein
MSILCVCVCVCVCVWLVFCLFVFWKAILGLEHRAYTLSHQPFLVMSFFFKIESHKLFAQAGFKLQFS